MKEKKKNMKAFSIFSFLYIQLDLSKQVIRYGYAISFNHECMSSRKTFSAAVYLLLLLFSYNSWLPIRKLVKKPEKSGVVLKAYFICVFSYAMQCVFIIVLLFHNARYTQVRTQTICNYRNVAIFIGRDRIQRSISFSAIGQAFLNLTASFEEYL